MLSPADLQMMADAMPIATGVLQFPDLQVLAANRPMRLLLPADSDTNDLHAPVNIAVRQLKETGQVYRLPQVALKGGYWDLAFNPLKNSDDQIYAIVCTATEVTDQVTAIKNLQLNEELARLTTEAVELGVYDADLLTGEVVVSDKLNAIYGFTDQPGLPAYRNAIHPDDLPERDRAFEEALKHGRLTYEVRIYTTNGALKWVRAEGKVTYNDVFKPVRLIGTLTDITALRRDREIQRKLKTLADHSADLMSLLELEGVNSYINESGKRLLGFADDAEVQQTPIASLHRPEDFEQVRSQVLPAVLDKGRWTGTMMVRHLKTGEVFPVLNDTIRIDDPVTGKPIGIGAIMRDLRPELAAKKALADSENLLKNVTSAAPTALWMSDANGAITYGNQTWIDWTGQTDNAHLGNGWLQALHPDDREPVRKEFLAALDARKVFNIEYRLLDSSGNLRWCQASGRPQFDSSGIFAGYVGAVADLTAQKQLQQHKDDFISIASHELKTPVTSLKASLQLLERLQVDPTHPMFKKLLLQAAKSTSRIGTLVDELLSVGRLQQKEMALNYATFAISHLLNNCANPISLTAGKRIRVSGDLELELTADEGRIDQVVTNLLGNAVKYAPESPAIDIVISREGEMARVEVIDHGPGIPAEKTAQLFQRYYRAGKEHSHVSGLGLGLYICKEIIEKHGGQIGVISNLGQGSTFWFTLPIKVEAK